MSGPASSEAADAILGAEQSDSFSSDFRHLAQTRLGVVTTRANNALISYGNLLDNCRESAVTKATKDNPYRKTELD